MTDTSTAAETIRAMREALAPTAARRNEVTEEIKAVNAKRDALSARRSAGEDVQHLIVEQSSLLFHLQRRERALSDITASLNTGVLRIERGIERGAVSECATCHHEALVILSYVWGDGAECQWCVNSLNVS